MVGGDQPDHLTETIGAVAIDLPDHLTETVGAVAIDQPGHLTETIGAVAIDQLDHLTEIVGATGMIDQPDLLIEIIKITIEIGALISLIGMIVIDPLNLLTSKPLRRLKNLPNKLTTSTVNIQSSVLWRVVGRLIVFGYYLNYATIPSSIC
jgi:hypothetical protein